MSLPAIAAATTITAGLAAGGYAYAAMWPTSQLFGHTIVAGNNPAEIALTFDDGPNPTYTPALLDLLDRHQIRATFFLIGEHVRRHPALAASIALRGHILGNHTQSHPKLLFCAPARVRQELVLCQQAIFEATGITPTLFRPPHSARRPDVLRIARLSGLLPVLWNITAADWKPIGADNILRNIQQGISTNQRHNRGSNVLLHDGSQLDQATGQGPSRQDTISAVAQLIEQAKNEALCFVTPFHWIPKAAQ